MAGTSKVRAISPWRSRRLSDLTSVASGARGRVVVCAAAPVVQSSARMVSLASSPARKVLLLLLCGCTSAQVLHESTTTNAAATAQSAQPAAAEPSATVASTVTAASEPAAATEPAATVAATAQPAAAEPTATALHRARFRARRHRARGRRRRRCPACRRRATSPVGARRACRWRRWRSAVGGALLVTAAGPPSIGHGALERVKLPARAGEPGSFMQLLAEVVRAEGLQGLCATRRTSPPSRTRAWPSAATCTKSPCARWGAATVSCYPSPSPCPS